MQRMIANGVAIDDTFAEAFGMRAAAIVITADSSRWARQAAVSMTGYATSVIGCGCEAAIDRDLPPDQTPDGRPGVRALIFAMSVTDLQNQLRSRVGQCVLTSPGSACYGGLEGEERLKLGDSLRYFGDGWQMSKLLGTKRYWRIPVMDGEFVCEATVALTREAVGGGNLLILGASAKQTLAAAETAVDAIEAVPDAIMPFPGGIVRSGSKIGARYKNMRASTNGAYCPTLRGVVETALDPEIACVLEIVIDGLTSEAVANAMRAGLRAIVELGATAGAARVSAGNYGGKLGPHHYHLWTLAPAGAGPAFDSETKT
jgi:formylmethanofuran--tetrahydromethanopterin N-formyltransferase